MSQPKLTERLGIVGSGAVARGLARVAAPLGDVILWARSGASADAARAEIGDALRVTTDLDALSDCTYVVESVVESVEVKAELLPRIAAATGDRAVVATTTSSLSVEALAAASGRPDRFAALHVFNPVDRMKLVELAFPPGAADSTRSRSHGLCQALGKTPVEVPDTPGFVVNRLLFPYLFDAVRFQVEHGVDAATVDSCMRLGAGHPMGPLKLLDLIGLDVSASIGESIGTEVPERVRELIAAGRLGRKSGAGFYNY